jgi:hypothetical protein
MREPTNFREFCEVTGGAILLGMTLALGLFGLFIFSDLARAQLPMPSISFVEGSTGACPDNDGSGGAATATIQYPSLLGTYSYSVEQIGCKVAGVDYGTGITTGTTLTDWQNGCSGCTVNTGQLRIDGNNVTLNGIDFSLHGGAAIYCPDCTGTLTVTNSNFACSTATYSYAIGATAPTLNLVVKNNNFAGDNCSGQSAFIDYSSTGTLTMQYNFFKHGWQHVIETGGANQTADYRFNWIEDMTIGAGQHMNFLQFGWGPETATVEHNTSYQHTYYHPAEGYQFYNGSGGIMSFTNIIFRYNTLIAVLDDGQDTQGNMIHGLCHSTGDCSSTLATVSGSCNLDHNYADVTGANALFYASGGTAMWTACTLANNINMVTGAAFSNSP